MQTYYNEVVVLQQGGDVLMKKWQVQEKTHMRDRDVRENEETKNENESSRDNL